MAAEPTLGAVWVRLVLDALAGLGFDAKRYCRRQGWDLDRLGESETRLPWSEVVALWQAAARSSGDSHLGLHAAENLPPRAEGPLLYLVMSSPTLLDGLSLALHYQDLHFDGRALSLDDRGDHFALGVRLPDSATAHQTEYLSVLLKRTCAGVVGPAFRLLAVRFRHGGPPGAAEHERVFECPVEFRQPENALLLARETVCRQSLYANAEVLRALQAIADRRLGELRSPTWVLKVKATLEPRLAAGSSLDDIAQELSVTRRTLQRKLAAERSSFARVLDQSRRERSLELIQDRGMTVAAIASAVGFADSRAFVRAFRRWTDLTPSAYRAENRSSDVPQDLGHLDASP